MPLHHAAAKGAPVDVMKLLLEADPQTATAVAQARAALSPCTQNPHAAGPVLRRGSPHSAPLATPSSYRPVMYPLSRSHAVCHGALRRTGSSPCTSLLPRAPLLR